MRLNLVHSFLLPTMIWAGLSTVTPTPTPQIYRSPDSVFESIVPEGWSVPTPEQEISTYTNRYQISYSENGEIVGYFRMYSMPLSYLITSDVPASTPKTLEAVLSAKYRTNPDPALHFEMTKAEFASYQGYRINYTTVVQAVNTYWDEERYASITPDEILVAEYRIPLRLADQFTTAYDLFFQYVHFWPQNIQTATPVPTATMPAASSTITDFSDAYSVQGLFGIVELQLPRGWKLVKDDPEHPRPYIMDFSISDQNVVFGSLSIQLMSVQALARSERETNPQAAMQAYIDHLMHSCCMSFSDISTTEVDGLAAYHSIQNDQDVNSWDGRYYRPIMDMRAVDIGSGEILLFTFIAQGGILPQLMPTYEAVLSQAIIHRENILTAPTPTPVPPQA